MEIVGALDLHRSQITYKLEDLETGEIRRGQIAPATRAEVAGWLEQFGGRDGHFVLEATTGWRFVVEEITRAGLVAHLAEPCETATRRGRKRRAKSDRADCDHLLRLLVTHDVPESWIPPTHILELRTLVRLRKALVEDRTEWRQRIQAQLFHHGVPRECNLRSRSGRAALAAAPLSPAARHAVDHAVAMIDFIDAQLDPLDRQLVRFSHRQPGARALQEEIHGVGPITATAIVAELGDCRRFSHSAQAVRATGLDVTVYESNGKRSRGHLSRQGPVLLRWALYEAAKTAAQRSSPDHAYYVAVRDRLGSRRATLSVARKIVRRAHHILRELGDDAIAPVDLRLSIDSAVAA